MASDDPDFKVSSSRPGRVPPTLDLKAEAAMTPPRPAGGAAPGGNATQAASGAASGTAGSEGAGKGVEAPPAGEGAAPRTAPNSEPDAAPGATPEAASKPASDTAGKPGGESEGKPGGESGRKPGAAAAPPPAAPPVAPPPRRAGLLFGALILGALAGAAAGAGTTYFLAQQALASATAAIAPLRTRLASIESRPVFNPETVSALSQRVEGLRTTLAEAQATLADLRPLLTRPAPESAPAPAPAPEPAAVPPPPAPAEPDPAVLRGLDDLRAGAQAFKDTLGAAQSQIGQLRGAVDQLRTSQEQLQTGQETVRTALSALGVTVAQTRDFGPRLDALKGQMEAAVAASGNLERAAAGMVVLGSLKEALVSGRPFAAELTAARAVLGPAASALDPVAAQAAAGFPTPADLAARLEREGAAALADYVTPPVPVAPAAPAEDAGVVTRFLSSAQNLVKVRPAPGTVPAQLRAALDGAAAAVKGGDFAGALTLIDTLPDPVKAKLRAVTADLAARRDAVRTAATLYQQSLAAISGKMP